MPQCHTDADFRIRGPYGDLLMRMDYMKDLDCFQGTGKEEDGTEVIKFCFWAKDSPMEKLEQARVKQPQRKPNKWPR